MDIFQKILLGSLTAFFSISGDNMSIDIYILCASYGSFRTLDFCGCRGLFLLHFLPWIFLAF